MGTFVSTKAYEAKTACASAQSSCGCGCFDKKTSVLLALDAIFMVSIYFVFTFTLLTVLGTILLAVSLLICIWVNGIENVNMKKTPAGGE